jgi:hypothetical protein
MLNKNTLRLGCLDQLIVLIFDGRNIFETQKSGPGGRRVDVQTSTDSEVVGMRSIYVFEKSTCVYAPCRLCTDCGQFLIVSPAEEPCYI